MLTIKSVTMTKPYGEEPHTVTAKIQFGDASYQSFDLELEPERVAAIMAAVRIEVGGQLGKVALEGGPEPVEQEAPPVRPDPTAAPSWCSTPDHIGATCDCVPF